ncbi:hypothetical protein [uncultured Sphingomonas sp.]|uniref:hypothetical protein n=1 Tax=uncultured Sphingomonas sp. TaxID=158754 RepID=UPI0035CBAC4C
MKRISSAALVAAMTIGAASVVAAPPAYAKKKDTPPAGALVLSEPIRVQAQAAKDAITASNIPAAEAAITQVETAATTDDEKYVGAVLRYAVESQKLYDKQKSTNGVFDARPLAAPLDVLIASPKTPATDLPKYLFTRGTVSFDQRNYAGAVGFFTRAKAAGSTEPNLPLYLIKSKVEGGDVAGGMADLDAVWTAKGPMTDDYYKYAIAKTNAAGMKAETFKWIKRRVAASPSSQTWRDAIVFYGLQQQPVVKLDKRQMIDLFRLMRRTKSLADQTDYEEYGQKAYDIGLPDEARTILNEGKTLGKIPATSSTTKSLLSDSATAIAGENFATLEKKAAIAPKGEVAAQTGDGYLGRDEYAKAIPLYRLALQKGVADTDQVNLHLGIALALSGDKEGARASFAAVKGAPRADIASLWAMWLDSPAAA